MNKYSPKRGYVETIISLQRTFISGVATGWHGWTMSRGPELKGPPRERERQRETERETKRQKRKWRKRKKEEKKREIETFQITGRGPHLIGNHHTIFEI